VTERFVVAKRGMDVVLECRDADSDTWVYWTKHGGKVSRHFLISSGIFKYTFSLPDPSVNVTGRHLRLFRVDRWDSGMYICSTNSSENPHYNVTVRVDSPPNVTAPRHGDKNGGELIARQVVGSPAILRCKVRDDRKRFYQSLVAPGLGTTNILVLLLLLLLVSEFSLHPILKITPNFKKLRLIFKITPNFFAQWTLLPKALK
jgi:hypothetical protein